MKVTIIDDSSFMRRLIRSALSETNPEAEVVEFDDATKALAAMPQLHTDLITLDLLMPGLNGLDFLALLRTTVAQSPRVIVITADVQKTVRQKCQEMGVVDFIEKPITPEKLRLALDKMISV